MHNILQYISFFFLLKWLHYMYYYFFYHFLSFPTFLWIIFINFHLLIFCVKISTDIFWYIHKIKLLRICQNRYFRPGFCWRINFVLWFAFISFFLEGSTYFLVLWIFFYYYFYFYTSLVNKIPYFLVIDASKNLGIPSGEVDGVYTKILA